MGSIFGFLRHAAAALGHLAHLVASHVEADPAGAAAALRTVAGAAGVPIPASVDKAIAVGAALERAAGK